MYQYYIKFYVNVKKLIVSCFLQNYGLLPEPHSGQNTYSYHFMGGSARPDLIEFFFIILLEYFFKRPEEGIVFSRKFMRAFKRYSNHKIVL